MNLKQSDPSIFNFIQQELQRQQEGLEMIASENCWLPLRSWRSRLHLNEYAEGYPGKRYYGGCHVVDEVESLAINRAKQLFGCEAVNVQPHSGSHANMSA